MEYLNDDRKEGMTEMEKDGRRRLILAYVKKLK